MRGSDIPDFNRGHPGRKYSVGEISLCKVLCYDLDILLDLPIRGILDGCQSVGAFVDGL